MNRHRLPTLAALGALLLLGAAIFEHAEASTSSFFKDERDLRLLSTALTRVERVYYQPIETQKLLDGERVGLEAELTHLHVSPARLPQLTADGDRNHDIAALQREVEIALDRVDASPKVHVDPVEVTQSGVRGMLAALHDPYTVYLTPREISTLEETLNGGDFGGIGVYIVQQTGTNAVLVDPIEGTPAAKAGLKPGDAILTINGQSIHGMRLDDVEHAIRGRIGTIVVLGVRSRGTKHSVSIVRDRIFVPSVHAKMINNTVDYVRLSDFGQTSYEEVRKALLDGKAHHAQGYILDLRDNGGGLLEAAVRISSLFIAHGTIVTQVDRNGNRASEQTTQSDIGTTPLVVLLNKYSASASEITAGAIQDYHAGTIIGTRSFGKGVVQSIYETDDGGALKITTARYLTPNGRSIDHHGIDPDIIIHQPADDVAVLGTASDAQLTAAENYLQQLARR
ncbi:MAG TPA: S41 family peptidase [Candidatus Baltobacteraceae bacterium]|jgi:carboxyl-terminal processing protease|nr:S41 family peptidase [Candidatus Baltobacteraceae bacterium]